MLMKAAGTIEGERLVPDHPYFKAAPDGRRKFDLARLLDFYELNAYKSRDVRELETQRLNAMKRKAKAEAKAAADAEKKVAAAAKKSAVAKKRIDVAAGKTTRGKANNNKTAYTSSPKNKPKKAAQGTTTLKVVTSASPSAEQLQAAAATAATSSKRSSKRQRILQPTEIDIEEPPQENINTSITAGKRKRNGLGEDADRDVDQPTAKMPHTLSCFASPSITAQRYSLRPTTAGSRKRTAEITAVMENKLLYEDYGDDGARSKRGRPSKGP